MADDKDTDSQQPPAKLPRLSGADTSAGKYVRALAFWSCSLLITLEFVRSFAGEVTMAASSPLVLGLGLGLGAGGGERDAEAASTGFLERPRPRWTCRSQYLWPGTTSREHRHFLPSVRRHRPGSGSMLLR